MLTYRIVNVEILRYFRAMTGRKVHDHYFHKAKKDKFSARSVYKLKDIQEKYKLIQSGDSVADLGAAPGSWCEYLSELLGPKGHLIALDEQPLSHPALQKMKKIGLKYSFLQQSVMDELPVETPELDAIVSDMAPFTQGNKLVDSARSLELSSRAFEIAKKHLKQGGHFVIKLFQSEDTMKAAKNWGKSFKFSKMYRPPAVQKASKETYFIGQNFNKETK
jgi:23S rRNA (uridine2552-2'-O)-methyltransferase